MPNWKDLLDATQAIGSAFDVTRRKYVRRYAKLTGRNVIAYYSGWLQKPELEKQGIAFSINDSDKNAFMAVIHRMDPAKGLDLFLHTPGGDIAATESLVDYLRKKFSTDIRAIIPQIAMSAGTMIASSCKEIVMGKHSSIGPIDPQFGPNISAHGIIEEFDQAKREIAADPATIPVWQAILAKYHPSLVGECVKADRWAKTLVKDWLVTGMFNGRPTADADATRVVDFLADHALTLSHGRHISAEQALKLGLNVTMLESPAQEKYQDAVLSVHHSYIQTITFTNAFKIVENHLGVAAIGTAQRIIVQQP